jgi:hypothetical protein
MVTGSPGCREDKRSPWEEERSNSVQTEDNAPWLALSKPSKRRHASLPGSSCGIRCFADAVFAERFALTIFLTIRDIKLAEGLSSGVYIL